MARYPFWRITLTAGNLYPTVYALSWMAAAIAFSMLFDTPADQARHVSWIVYGLAVTMLPGFGFGLLFGLREPRAPYRTAVHTVSIAFLIEKVALVAFADWLAGGFPAAWYGRGFPEAGTALLCEDLPYFCSGYETSYLFGSPVLFLLAYAAGYLTARPFGRTVDDRF